LLPRVRGKRLQLRPWTPRSWGALDFRSFEELLSIYGLEIWDIGHSIYKKEDFTGLKYGVKNFVGSIHKN